MADNKVIEVTQQDDKTLDWGEGSLPQAQYSVDVNAKAALGNTPSLKNLFGKMADWTMPALPKVEIKHEGNGTLDYGEGAIPQAQYSVHLGADEPEHPVVNTVPESAETFAATEPSAIEMTPLENDTPKMSNEEFDRFKLVKDIQDLLIEEKIDISFKRRDGSVHPGNDGIAGEKTMEGIKKLLGRDIELADLTPEVLDEMRIAANPPESAEMIAARQNLSEDYQKAIGENEQPGIVIRITKSIQDFADDLVEKNAGRSFLSAAHAETLEQGGLDGDKNTGIKQEQPDPLQDKNVNLWNVGPDSMAP